MKAVIPAAGLGTRFLPFTKNSPKEMIPLVDKPVIQYVVEEAVHAGIDDILIITGRGKWSIEDHFDVAYELEQRLEKRKDITKLKEIQKISELADIHYIRQKKPLGLGHAIHCAKKHVGDEPFAVLLGDDIIVSETPCIQQLMDQFQKYGSCILAVEHLPDKSLEKYGVIAYEDLEERVYQVTDIVEKPPLGHAPSDLATIGRYILPSSIFEYIEKTDSGHGGEIQLSDALNLLRKKEDIYAYEFQGTRYDLGDKGEWLKTIIDFALERREFREELLAHMEKKLRP